MKQLEAKIQKAVREIEEKRRRTEDFEQLCSFYEIYEQDFAELEKCRKDTERLLERKQLSNSQLNKLQEQLKTIEFQKANLIKEETLLQESFRCYADYNQKPQIKDSTEIETLSIADMEARFKAITSGLSQALKELETQEQKALKRYQDAEKELERLRIKYRLEHNVWLDKDYNEKEETHLEIKLEDLKKKLKTKKCSSIRKRHRLKS